MREGDLFNVDLRLVSGTTFTAASGELMDIYTDTGGLAVSSEDSGEDCMQLGYTPLRYMDYYCYKADSAENFELICVK